MIEQELSRPENEKSLVSNNKKSLEFSKFRKLSNLNEQQVEEGLISKTFHVNKSLDASVHFPSEFEDIREDFYNFELLKKGTFLHQTTFLSRVHFSDD